MRTLPLLIFILFTVLSEATAADTIPTPPKKKLSAFRRMVRNFSRVDTNYIEPQKYNFTVMLQNTTSFEGYTLKLKDDHSVVFAPEPSYKLGPYFGWRFVFIGYTIDIKRLKNERSTMPCGKYISTGSRRRSEASTSTISSITASSLIPPPTVRARFSAVRQAVRWQE